METLQTQLSTKFLYMYSNIAATLNLWKLITLYFHLYISTNFISWVLHNIRSIIEVFFWRPQGNWMDIAQKVIKIDKKSNPKYILSTKALKGSKEVPNLLLGYINNEMIWQWHFLCHLLHTPKEMWSLKRCTEFQIKATIPCSCCSFFNKRFNSNNPSGTI